MPEATHYMQSNMRIRTIVNTTSYLLFAGGEEMLRFLSWVLHAELFIIQLYR